MSSLITFLSPLICDRLQQPYIEKRLLFYIFRQVFVNNTGDNVWQNSKCEMGEMLSENVFLRVTYFLNGPKRLFEETIYGMPI